MTPPNTRPFSFFGNIPESAPLPSFQIGDRVLFDTAEAPREWPVGLVTGINLDGDRWEYCIAIRTHTLSPYVEWVTDDGIHPERDRDRLQAEFEAKPYTYEGVEVCPIRLSDGQFTVTIGGQPHAETFPSAAIACDWAEGVVQSLQ